MEKLNKNTIAECYAMKGSDIAQGYADYLRFDKKLKEKKVSEEFYAAFYIWHHVNSYIFWDILFSWNIADKLKDTIPTIGKKTMAIVEKNMVQFREWLFNNVTKPNTLRDEYNYRNQGFFEDICFGLTILDVWMNNDNEINWNDISTETLKKISKLNDYETAFNFWKALIFMCRNKRPVQFWFQKRIVPINKQYNIKQYTPKRSKHKAQLTYYVFDKFKELDQYFTVCNTAKTGIECFESIEGGFIHTQHENIGIKYHKLSESIELYKDGETVCELQYHDAGKIFSLIKNNSIFHHIIKDIESFRLLNEKRELIATITYGPNEIQYQLVQIKIEEQFKKYAGEIINIGFGALLLRSKFHNNKDKEFPYLYYPIWISDDRIKQQRKLMKKLKKESI